MAQEPLAHLSDKARFVGEVVGGAAKGGAAEGMSPVWGETLSKAKPCFVRP